MLSTNCNFQTFSDNELHTKSEHKRWSSIMVPLPLLLPQVHFRTQLTLIKLKTEIKRYTISSLSCTCFWIPITQLSSRMLRWHLLTTTPHGVVARIPGSSCPNTFGEYQICESFIHLKAGQKIFESFPRWMTTKPPYIKLACQGRCLKLIKVNVHKS